MVMSTYKVLYPTFPFELEPKNGLGSVRALLDHGVET